MSCLHLSRLKVTKSLRNIPTPNIFTKTTKIADVPTLLTSPGINFIVKIIYKCGQGEDGVKKSKKFGHLLWMPLSANLTISFWTAAGRTRKVAHIQFNAKCLRLRRLFAPGRVMMYKDGRDCRGSRPSPGLVVFCEYRVSMVKLD